MWIPDWEQILSFITLCMMLFQSLKKYQVIGKAKKYSVASLQSANMVLKRLWTWAKALVALPTGRETEARILLSVMAVILLYGLGTIIYDIYVGPLPVAAELVGGSMLWGVILYGAFARLRRVWERRDARGS